MNNNLETLAAKLVSIIFNPFLIITLAMALGNYRHALNNMGALITFIAISLLLPLVYYMIKITSHKAHFFQFVNLPRKVRNEVFLIIVINLFVTSLVFANLNEYYWFITSIMLMIFVSTLFLLNKFIDKVSVHVAVFAFSVFYLVDKFTLTACLLLVFLPLIFWSRIHLHKHTWIQLYLGLVAGIGCGVLSWLI